MSKIKKLEQIEHTDHYSVFDKNGKKICDCADIQDTLMMVSLGEGRTYKQVKILLDQIVNIPHQRMADDKQLKEQKILEESKLEVFQC